MRTFIHFSVFIFFFAFLCSCKKESIYADVIFINGNIYTVDSLKPSASVLAVSNHRIIGLGDKNIIDEFKNEDTKIIDLENSFVMPGFIEGHGHFGGFGEGLQNLNFLHSKSWDDVIKLVEEKVKTAKPGEWIVGRGWHQEKWDEIPLNNVLGYPFHDELSAISPNNPVLLRHASGHAVFANERAMKEAGISKESPNPLGGEIVRDLEGEAIGVFEERAMNLVSGSYQDYLKSLDPERQKKIWFEGLELAQKECLKNGITSFQDAGTKFKELQWLREWAESGNMDIRLWAMIRESYDDMDGKLNGFPWLNLGDYHFTVRAIKSEVDGALGAFGAWLLKPYADKYGFSGQNTTPLEEVDKIANLAAKHQLQFCVHAIGDRANKEVLDIFEQKIIQMKGKESPRWRMEHAQHLDTLDIPRFKKWGIIASMQGIHCTSDAPFVVKRLGVERSRTGAYPWRSLIDNGALIANGTDVPVEEIDPIACFYASVTRKRADTGFEFFPEQRMTRKEAISSYTLWNAFAAFEENDKGSLSIGKLADMVVLSNNLLTCSDEDILNTKVLMTIVGGDIKYRK
ncbi:MAG: amidohydrolase [Haliscomenobacter sp.]|nr:amidohydrolase [Haliscomenobacter sp.]MCF8317537.1 amidohydrolase [Haliscomenobacter sp.]